MIAHDTETRSLRWWENPAFLGSWDVGEGGQIAVLPTHAEPRNVEAFERALESERVHIGANTKFDAHQEREAFGKEMVFRPGNTVHDVLLESRLVYGRRVAIHGLKELATQFVDPEAANSEKEMEDLYYRLTGRSNMKHDDAYYVSWLEDPELVEKYARWDATYTLKLHHILHPQIQADAKLAALYKLEREVQEVLYDAERIGIRVDPEAVARLGDHYRERDEAARGALESTLGFVPEGEGSADRLREALVEAGVPLTERTEKTGELAVNRKALEPYEDHPAVAALFEWRRVNKFLSTYIGPLERREDEIVHASFGQADAWTGRMASREPNMQNFPKRSEQTKDASMKIRSVFIPRPGMEYIIADFSSIEMFVLAYILGDANYRREVAEGDPHAKTAAAAFSQISTNPADFYKGTENRWIRDVSKHGTYAMVYGGGGPVVMSTLNKMMMEAGHPEMRVSLEQTRGIIKKIKGAIPGFKALTDTPWKNNEFPCGRLCQQLKASEVDGYGYVRTAGGRKQWIKMDKMYVALSGYVQGTAADIMKQAAVNVRQAMKPYGAYPLLFVHDELVVEAPLGEGERLRPIVEEAMIDAAPEGFAPRLQVESHVTKESYAHV
jgi:DNA polymerase-1